mgnify:CR=1 FL=1
MGVIIEKITKLPLEQVYKKYIFEPLDMKNTYLLIGEDEFVPNVFYKEKAMHRPKLIMSSSASGGGYYLRVLFI